MDNSIYTVGRKMMYCDLEPLWKALSGINYAVVKGEVLSQQIYGVPNKRVSGDIDILINKSNISTVEKELVHLGYTQRESDNHHTVRSNRILCLSYSHQIPSYHKDKFGFHFNVDINHDIFWGEYDGKKCSMELFLDDVEVIHIYDKKIKALPMEKAFLHLLLHHYKEMNSILVLSNGNSISSQKFRDILDMIRMKSSLLDINTICSLCSKYQIGEIVYYMFFYTYCVFHDDSLLPYISMLKDYKNDEIMNSFGLCPSERKEWRIPFSQRLDNDDIWKWICNDLTDNDIKKIERGKSVFT